jgi:hypothetical protein
MQDGGSKASQNFFCSALPAGDSAVDGAIEARRVGVFAGEEERVCERHG